MDYEQRMRLKGRLQRMGAPAMLEEIIRQSEELDILKLQVQSILRTLDSAPPTAPASTPARPAAGEIMAPPTTDN